MTEALAERVRALIADTKGIPPESVGPDATFVDLGIDSLDALNIAFALEEEFHIAIPDDELRQLKTVEEAVAGVRRLMAQRDSGAQAART